MNNDALNATEIADLLASLDGWEYSDSDGALRVTFHLSTAAKALAFISTIGSIAEELNHHPDVDWRYNRVIVASSTHDAGNRVTAKDAELARRIAAEFARLQA